MHVKRAGSTPGKRCQRCSTIRTFVAIAAMLIVAMPFVSDKAAPLSALTPAHFAYSLMGAGCVGFVIRWLQWRREKTKQSPLNSNTPR